MKKILLLIIAPFVFLSALSAQITQEEANKIVLERMSQETQPYTIYTQEKLQEQGVTITVSAGEVIELDYPCWVYSVDFRQFIIDPFLEVSHIKYAPTRFLIVKKSDGNLLEINSDNAWLHLAGWRIVPKNSNYSVWRSEIGDNVIEFTFYPSENKLQLRTTPEQLPSYIYFFTSSGIFDYHIIGNKMYFPGFNPAGKILLSTWTIDYLSENKIYLKCNDTLWTYGTSAYYLICQTDFKEI